MKTIVFFLVGMLLTTIAFGQVKEGEMVHVDEVKVVPPKFVGIENSAIFFQNKQKESIEEYMAKNIVYEVDDNKPFKQGTVVVRFVISPMGEVSEFDVINSVADEIDDEVIRVLETTNRMWMPGYNNEKAVAMEKEIAVGFIIEGSMYSKEYRKRAGNYFTKASETLLVDGNAKKAVKIFNKAVHLVPRDQATLFMRGMALYETGNKEDAYRDWERINLVGGHFDYQKYLADCAVLKGYAEAKQVIQDRSRLAKH